MFPLAPRSIAIRIELSTRAGSFATVATAVGSAGADLGAIDLVSASPERTVRDLMIGVQDEAQAAKVIAALGELPDVKVLRVSDRLFLMHLGGKIRIEPKVQVMTRHALSMIYTPGVAEVCRAIQRNPAEAHNLTIKRNSVAIVTDGSAVLGLGNIGPEAALPVMEGKSALFRQFASVDAFPLCIATQNVEEIIQFCQMAAPTFGAINLEDISSPRCFEIEARLRASLDIPVVHDDQHGTAVAVLAAIMNALVVVKKDIRRVRLVLMGAGAAGTGCARLLHRAGLKNIIAVDYDGILGPQHRRDPNPAWRWFATHTNTEGIEGDISRAALDADIFLGLSGPDVFPESALRSMARDSIVFAMANPKSEISLDVARSYARIVGSGRSDQPNQINNVLVFPGLFRGLLDCRASGINDRILISAAKALARLVPRRELSTDYILPSVFDPRVAPAIAAAVMKAAKASGLARRQPKSTDGVHSD